MKNSLRYGCGCLVIALALASVPPAAAADRMTDVLWVQGMTYPDCDDLGLQLLLESLPGVDRVNVEFATGRTAVSYDPERLAREELIAEIRNRGFEVPWVTDTFVVGWDRGDDACSCRHGLTVKLLVGSLEGVDEILVDEATTRTSVRYDPGRVSRGELLAEIANLGWETELVAAPLTLPSP